MLVMKLKFNVKLPTRFLETLFVPCSGMLSHGAPVRVANPSIALPDTRAS